MAQPGPLCGRATRSREWGRRWGHVRGFPFLRWAVRQFRVLPLGHRCFWPLLSGYGERLWCALPALIDRCLPRRLRDLSSSAGAYRPGTPLAFGQCPARLPKQPLRLLHHPPVKFNDVGGGAPGMEKVWGVPPPQRNDDDEIRPAIFGQFSPLLAVATCMFTLSTFR